MGDRVPMAIPPHSLEAEKSVLGSMLQDAVAVDKAISALTPEDFYSPAHREIFSSAVTLFKTKSPVDLVTVDNELSRRGTLEGVGGPTYLVELSQFVPTTVNVQAYIAIVIEKSKLRRMITASQTMAAEAYSGITSADEIRDTTILGLKEIKTSDAPEIITMEQAVERLLDRISEISKTPEDGRIATSIPPLDKIIRISSGKIIVIAARPSVGKSALALQIARNAAGKGKRTLFSSLEMTEEETAARVLSTLTGIPTGRIETGNLTDEDYMKIGPLCGEAAKMPILTTKECSTVPKLRRAAFAATQDDGLDMIIVDYIQLMTTGNKKQNRNEQITEVSRELKHLAQELKIPVIVLSQFNRLSEGGTTRGGGRVHRTPVMSDSRDSGAIEQDADIFLTLHDPDESELPSPEDQAELAELKANDLTLTWIIVDKNRNGRRKCTVRTAFDGGRMQFTALARKDITQNAGANH